MTQVESNSPFDALARRVAEINKKSPSDLTADDERTIQQFLEQCDIGVARDMLEFPDTPEQRAVTIGLLQTAFYDGSPNS